MKCQVSLVLVGALGTLAATTAAQTRAGVPGPAYTYAVPPAQTDGWATGSLEQAGIDRHRIEQMTDSIRAHPEWNVHAVLIERAGRLVYEEYFSGKDERWGQPLGVVTFNRGTLHDLRSVTKSVVSALVGIAASSGAIPSLDAPLLDYFPEYKDLDVPERRRITIRHALSMSAGFEWNEDVPYNDPKNDEIVMNRSPDPLHYVLARPMVSAPGTSWRYNGGTTQVLGTIVQRATKRPLADYAGAMLFGPLGITESEWLGNLAGVPSAASGLRLRPRDLAKFGSLYLHDGLWNGRQIIPKEWVYESTRRRLTFPGQEAKGYAYQWWHTCYPTPSGLVEVPIAVGNGSQRIFLVRAQQTVVTVLAGRYNDFSSSPPERLLLDFILPALPPAPASRCPSQSPASIVGTWKVVTYEDRSADGAISHPYGEHPAGYFVYDATGHMSAHVMRTPALKPFPGMREGSSDAASYREAYLAYFAYFGTYTVDAEKGTVTHHVEGSLKPEYTGTDQVRPFRIEGDRLIIEFRQGQQYLRRELTRVK